MEGTFGSLKEKFKENNEILFYGIGGQGVVTASYIFLETLTESKWNLTGVYSPGAERRGKTPEVMSPLPSPSSPLSLAPSEASR